MLTFLQLIVFLGVAGLFAKLSLKKVDGDLHLVVPRAITGVGALVATGIFLSSFGTIGAGERGIVMRMGAVTGRTVDPGLFMVTPMVESVHPMNIQIQKESAKAAAPSKDIQQVTTEVALNYSINPTSAATLYKTVGDDFKNKIIDPAIQEAVKATTARYNAEQLISERHLVKEDLITALRGRLGSLGIIVEEISMTDFAFDPEFMKAVEAKVTSQQLALKAANDVVIIHNEQQAKYETARADSYVTVTDAKAAAEAIKIQTFAINAQGGRDYINLQAIEKWNGELPQQMLGSTPVPFLNIGNTTPKKEN